MSAAGSSAPAQAAHPWLIEHWRRYLTTYRQPPGEATQKVEISEMRGRDEGLKIVRLSLQDYHNHCVG